jgi:hypothetical protein
VKKRRREEESKIQGGYGAGARGGVKGWDESIKMNRLGAWF